MTDILKGFYRILRPFVEPSSAPILFVIGLILLNLISNALYDYAGSVLGAPLRIFLFAIGFLMLFLIFYALAQRYLRSELTIADITPRRGLIVLVSQGRMSDIPASSSIAFHLSALTHCWLITSPQPQKESEQPVSSDGEPMQSAWKNAQDIKSKYDGKLKYIEVIEIDPENPREIFQAVENIFSSARRLKLHQNDIVADFTGGTKTMSISMVLACTPAGRNAEYLRPRSFLPDGRADIKAGSDPKLVDLSFLIRASDTDLE